MNLPSAAVVICAYTEDRWDDLRSSVASAADQVPPPADIVVVVDHNQELLERVRAELVPQQPGLRVLANHRRSGLSGARNTAVESVWADLVVFLDDDASARSGWLAALCRHYEDASVLAVGGVASPRWPAGRSRPTTLPADGSRARGELDWVVGCTYAGQPVTASPVRNLMGCNMSFRLAVFDRIGGFSEDLGRVGKTPLGCEETELCIRAQAAYPQGRIVFEPQALVHHHVSPDRLTWAYLRRRCYAEGLSKAAVSALVGSDRALATERRYVTTVLPRGLLRELRAGVTGRAGGWSHLGGAAAIVTGLAATVLGYGRARLAGATLQTSGAPRLVLRSSAAQSEPLETFG